MATYNSILRPFCWINADELGEWLGTKEEKYEVPTSGIAANKVIQDLLYEARDLGVGGNSISIEYVGGGTAGSELVAVVGNVIAVTIEDNVSTTTQIKNAVLASGPAAALVSCVLNVVDPDTPADVENRTQILQVQTLLEGGVDDTPYPKNDVPKRRRRYEEFINAACSKIETILETNVLEKQYQEDLDGNDSNVIVPSKWPMISIQEVKIDYNRDFGVETIVDQLNVLFRGQADKRMDTSVPELRIVGSDIYLRDDDNDNVIGRIFSGSVAGSVRVIYTAGHAKDIDDVPSDLRLAAFQLAEWYELRRSNRDIGVSSKGVRGESYSRMGDLEDGIPAEIHGLIQPFINVGYPMFSRIQNNIFGV